MERENVDKLLSGNILKETIHNFLSTQSKSQLKYNCKNRGALKVMMFRSKPFNNFLKILKKKTLLRSLAHQHDILLIFLNWYLLDDDFNNVEQPDETGRFIDIITQNDTTYELKTRSEVSIHDIPGYIGDFYNKMCEDADQKQIWWFAFFAERIDPKAKKGGVCIYYLNVIEIDVHNYPNFHKARNKLIKEVLKMVEVLRKHVCKIDGIEDTGFLWPVENFWIVESLKKDVDEKDQLLGEKEQIIEKKEQIIEKKDQLLEEKEQVIAQLKLELKRLKK